MTSDVKNKLEEIGLEFAPYWSEEYLKNVEQWSKPEHEIKAEKDVFVTTRDGTEICVDVFRPDADGRYPALLACSGYSKDVQTLGTPPLPWTSPLFDHTVEAGDHEFFVSRGYAHIIMDARGTGKSKGEYYGPYCKEEQEDCVDLIDWISKQPWCNGKVAMVGISWFSTIQLLTAGHRPPALKAIFTMHFNGNFYNHAYHEGIPWNYYWYHQNVTAVNNGRLVAGMEGTEEELKQRIAERLSDPDIGTNSYYVRLFSAPQQHTWFTDILLHPLDGPFWQVRSPENKYEHIDVPVYLGTSWGGSPENRDAAFEALGALKVPKRLIGWTFMEHYDLPCKFLNGEFLRWYDYHLKDIDTGIMDEPLMKLHIRGTDRFRYEHEWPLARTEWTKLHLHRFGRLRKSSEDRAATEPDVLTHLPPTQAAQGQPLTYRTEPFGAATEVTGPLALKLFTSIDQTDANLIINVSAVSPQGEKTKLQQGFLKVSHRALNEAKTKPWKPVHDHTQAVPAVPGEIYELDIAIGTICYLFRPGQRLELEISTQDATINSRWEKMSTMGHLPSARLTRYNVYRDAEHKSHLLVPFIPDADKDQWL